MKTSPALPTVIRARRSFHPGLALGLLLIAVVASVSWVRWSGVPIRADDEAPIVQRALRFSDMRDGSIAVIDAASGKQIHTVSGEQGFMRGSLRALVRERKLRGIGPAQPFALVARKDGRLTLEDPATGARIDLESFGPTNAAVFVRLLTPAAPQGHTANL